MQILTVENQGIAINSLQDEIDDDMRFSVFDNSDVQNPDFYFVPLVFLESFSAPTAVLQIGDQKIQMPLDWCVAVGDDEAGDVERLAALNTFATSWDYDGDGIIDNSGLHTYQDLLTTNYSTLNVHILAYDVNKNLITLPVGETNTITHPLKQNIKN